MIQKSLANKPQIDHDKIEEVDSSAEQSDHDPKIHKIVQKTGTMPLHEEESNANKRISIHVGSVEEYLGSKILFEQGQMQVGDYSFFINVYFIRFKLDHIHDYKDFHKIMEFDVISKNHKLYAGKDFSSDYIQQLERSKKELTEYISY